MPMRVLVVLLGTSLLAACSSVHATNEPSAAVTSAIATAASSEIEQKHIPSIAIALIGREGVLYADGWGSSSNDREAVPTVTTLYRAGSVSKLLTDIAVMRLVERGVLDLDAPVQRYLDDFKPRNPYATAITLRHLMTHRSGLVREAPRGNYFDSSSPSQAATVASLNETTLVAEPGTHTKYSNAGIAVVGEVVARVSGTSYDAAVATLVTRPSGMSVSVFHRDQLRAAVAYSQMVGFEAARFPAPEFDLGTPAAGGLYTTLEDLGRFVQMLLDGGVGPTGQRVLKPETLAAMWRPQVTGGYGIGFSVSQLDGQRSVGHGGAIYGHMTYLRLLPDKGIGVVAFSTVDAGPTASRVGEFALRAWLASIEKRALPTFAVGTPIRDATAERMAGFFSDGKDSLQTRLLDGRLYLDAPTLAGFVTKRGEGYAIDDAQTYLDGLRIASDVSWIELEGRRYQRVAQRPPVRVAPGWAALLGEYGWDHNVQRIYVRDGKLYARLEWTEFLPLEPLARDEYAMPADRSFYPLEKLRFQRDRSGRVIAMELSGIVFPRRVQNDD